MNLPSSFFFSYDDPHILAGQGTAALEVLEQMSRLDCAPDAVVIPVGGGGLLAGMATAIKHLSPSVEIIVRDLSLYIYICLSLSIRPSTSLSTFSLSFSLLLQHLICFN